MWKALLQKQFLELNQTYFQDKKKGKRRSKGGTIGFISLMVILFLVLAAVFLGVGNMLLDGLSSMGLDWMYFAMMGLIALLLGVFGDVFNTYAGLYHAKDNELLLSMPIPPMKLLLMRLVGVYAMGLLYSGIVWVPAMVAYWIWGNPTVLGVILPILLFFVLDFFVLVLTCILGYVVALIASRLKNKSAVTVLLSLVFIAAYYFFYFRASEYLQNLLLHAEELSGKMQSKVWPLYQFGLGATGKIVPFLIVTAMVAVLFAVTVVVLSRSFVRIATVNRGEKKTVYREKTAKVQGIRPALIKKEWKRFTSSATYMLNCGLGLLFLIAGGVLVLVKGEALRENVVPMLEVLPEVKGLIPIAVLVLVFILGSMNCISAPSVSLEGKSIYLVQSMPIRPWDVLWAKEMLHIRLNLLPCLFFTAVLCEVLKLETTGMALALLGTIIFVAFHAAFGLVLNLWKPNLSWTSEVVPVKQGASVALALFGSWGIALVIGAGAWFSRKLIAPTVYLAAVVAVLAVAALLLNRWLKTKGAKIFAEL